MGRLAKQFSADDLRAISLAIRDAESRSGCEIIPVFATDSGRYDRGEDVFGVFCGIMLVVIFWLGLSAGDSAASMASGLWGGSGQNGALAPLSLLSIVGLIMAGFVGGTFLATKIPALKTLFVSRQEMREEVKRAAQACFYNQGIRKASYEAGVLIYVSAYERMAEIIGDDAVSAYLDEADWQGICDVLLAGMKQKNPVFGFVSAINKTGLLLDGAFIKQVHQGAHFADELVILE